MNAEEAYQAALDYLYSFVDFSLSKAYLYAPEKYDLNRMRAFLSELGNPERSYPIIHIAGTKGKGSVAALCNQAAVESGLRTGLYTSPHLIDFTERIQVNGVQIPRASLVELVDKIKPAVASIPRLTTFEITTALALLYFAESRVDAAVLEVGLGGRLDATNAVHPDVTVITSISFDHTQLLGDTLGEIAGEKAGILKKGVPLILAPQKEAARSAILDISEQRDVPVVEVGVDWEFALLGHSIDGQEFIIWSPAEREAAQSIGSWTPLQLRLNLLGEHQVENAATAYAALKCFSPNGKVISNAAIKTAFERVSWPGRFEILQREPPIVIDCAHNRDSAYRLHQTLDTYFPDRPVILVIGASEDKDIEGFFSEIMPRVSRVIAAKSYHPRAIDPQPLVDLARRAGKPAIIIEDVAEALEEAVRTVGPDEMVLATGSIFIVGGAREAWLAWTNSGGKL